jgi:hypothetical protein
VPERTEEPQSTQIDQNQSRFASLGVGVGAVFPSLIVGTFVIWDKSFLAGPHLWIDPEGWYALGVALCFVGFALAQVGINLPAGSGLTSILMLLAGAISVLSLEAFVISTGGPILSVFSFYYLYIPVVVGITFPRSLTVYTGIVCWIMCITALWLTWDPTTWRSSAQLMGTTLHSIVYGIIFTVQMIVTIAMIYLGQGNQGLIPVEPSPIKRGARIK